MRLSQLRELARRLGVGRYSSMLREQLMAAIQARSSRIEAPDLVSAAPAVESPLPPTQASDLPLDGVAAPPATVDQPLPAQVSLAVEPSPPAGEVMTPPSPPQEVVSSPPSTWVALLPRDPQWATVCWGISSADRERALAAGGQQLALRLTDVTDTAAVGSRPHTLQEVIVEGGAKEWHLPVPLGGRDYRVELGYRILSGGWVSLASSSVTHIAAETQFTTEPFAPFTLAGDQQASFSLPPLSAPGLHERLYQQASAGRLPISQGSEAFQEHEEAGAAAAGQFSGVGPWASGREASGAGLAPRQRSFWLVADAELIVYGATDPAATLTVGDQVTPLAQDGTFSFHTAFPDGEQQYPIRALAADGEQKRSITIDFRRSTPHAKVNSKESAVPEWF